MKRNLLIILVIVFAISGAVYALDRAREREVTQAPPLIIDTVRDINNTSWQTFNESGVEFKLPPGYKMDPGAGQRYVVRDDPNNPSPTPDMHISSDGQQVNFRRWEGNSWQYWDQVIASIRIKTPLTHQLQINIDK